MQEQEAAEFNVQRAINQARDKINAKRKGKQDIKSQAERLIKAINRERELLDNAAEENKRPLYTGRPIPVVSTGSDMKSTASVPINAGGSSLGDASIKQPLINNIQQDGQQVKPNNNRRGYVDLSNPERAVIGLTQHADASTFLHELWHISLDDLLRFGTREGVSEQVRADRQTAMDWLEITEPILTTRIECALHKRNGRVRTKYQ